MVLVWVLAFVLGFGAEAYIIGGDAAAQTSRLVQGGVLFGVLLGAIFTIGLILIRKMKRGGGASP
jgi:hypothetical protein